jgi:pimeloyl-ACP methyl ester carboxylesterase
LGEAQDRVIAFPLTEALAQKIFQDRLRIFPDAAHLLFLEKSEAVNKEIIEFLSAR